MNIIDWQDMKIHDIKRKKLVTHKYNKIHEMEIIGVEEKKNTWSMQWHEEDISWKQWPEMGTNENKLNGMNKSCNEHTWK